MTDPDAIVFDLGNVLIGVDFERAFAHWADCSGQPVARLRARWRSDGALAAHERGELDDQSFFAHLDVLLGTHIGSHAIAAGWQAVFTGLIEPIVAELPALSARRPLYLYSNTNAAHTPTWRSRFGDALLPHFRGVYLSHEIGRRKPDVTSFEWLARELGVPPERLLFLDDSPGNVAGARAAGWRAEQVVEPAATARVLRELGARRRGAS